MVTGSRPRGQATPLTGRHAELSLLDGLVQAVRAGESRVLVVHGEPGVGKTALLDYLIVPAWGCRVVRAAGVESEMDLIFAGLHQLCAPFLDRIEWLPEPQRNALGTAFGLRGGPAPDRFAVGLAVLGLLADAAGARPVVCAVDDVQWMDPASAQALAFVARHLAAGPVAVVITVRSDGGDQYLAGLTELVVRGLADADARALLDAAVTGPVDERVRDRIVAETRGNPRALLEVARGLIPGDLAGGFGLPGLAAPPGRSEESRPAPGPCSARASAPNGCTSRRSGGSAGPASGRNWPARTCSTASGCVARTAALTPASSFGRPTRC